MSAHAAEHDAMPAVDEGNPPRLFALLRQALSPTPGRLGDTLRLVVLVLIVAIILETFRIPEIAVACYIVLFVSRAEAASTVMTALIAGIAVILAIFATIVVFMLSLSQPALRIPLIAATTFVAMFLSRASPLGAVFVAAGFIMGYGLTLGDELLGLSLLPGTVANAPEFSLPELAFIPPEEALLHFLLWLSLVVAIPIALVVIGNLLTGRDPALILQAEIKERLEAAARFCEGEPGAERQLAKLEGQGTAELLELQHLSGLLHRSSRPSAGEATLIPAIGRLFRLLLAWRRVTDRDVPQDWLMPAAKCCRDAARAVGGGMPVPFEAPEVVLTGVAEPLGKYLSRTLRAIRDALMGTSGRAPQHSGAPRRLLAADAFSNPAYPRFAYKVTLAVMLCYIGEDLANWPGIHTIIITCYFISLGTVGETVHKATLRFVGCLIGAALGIGAILLVMPFMTDLSDLLLLLAPVTFLAAWIACGSERIAYAGLQIALAFYLAVLQDYGPTLDMETARDRIIGILIGNLVVFVIFTTIWPVNAAGVARANLAKAIEQFAALFKLDPLDATSPDIDATEAAHRSAFDQAIAQARAVMVNDPFETRSVRHAGGRRSIDAKVLAEVQALRVPVTVILDLRHDPAWQEIPEQARQAIGAHHASLASWFQRAALWVSSGTGAADISSGLPHPPFLLPFASALQGPAADHLACRAVWYGLLHQDIRTILNQVVPTPQPRPIVLAQEAAGATG